MTDILIHRKNISTYQICEHLIKNVIRDLCKVKGYDETLNTYYEHLERIQQLKNDYIKQNNLKFASDYD